MIAFLVELFWSAMLQMFLWIVLLPAAFIVMTPIILIGAIFASEPYLSAVCNGYDSVYLFWRRIV